MSNPYPFFASKLFVLIIQAAVDVSNEKQSIPLMQINAFAYWKVVKKRIIDAIGMKIRSRFCVFLEKELHVSKYIYVYLFVFISLFSTFALYSHDTCVFFCWGFFSSRLSVLSGVKKMSSGLQCVRMRQHTMHVDSANERQSSMNAQKISSMKSDMLKK